MATCPLIRRAVRARGRELRGCRREGICGHPVEPSGRSSAAHQSRKGLLMPAQPTFDHYYGYDELTTILHNMAAAHPELMRLESIGKSHEGREIWLATAPRL